VSRMCEEKEQTIRAGKRYTAQLLTANCGGGMGSFDQAIGHEQASPRSSS